MKAIKVCESNESIIHKALAAINGSASSHTVSSYLEVEDIAQRAETRLQGLVPNKKDMSNAIVRFTSGGPMPNAYRYRRIGTMVELTRKSRAWYVTAIKRVDLDQRGGGRRYLLTSHQADLAVQNFKSKFSILPI